MVAQLPACRDTLRPQPPISTKFPVANDTATRHRGRHRHGPPPPSTCAFRLVDLSSVQRPFDRPPPRAEPPRATRARHVDPGGRCSLVVSDPSVIFLRVSEPSQPMPPSPDQASLFFVPFLCHCHISTWSPVQPCSRGCRPMMVGVRPLESRSGLRRLRRSSDSWPPCRSPHPVRHRSPCFHDAHGGARCSGEWSPTMPVLVSDTTLSEVIDS